MNCEAPMLLLGIGTAGAAIARGVRRAFGDGLRYVLADTDAATGEAGGPFALLGGDRLSGRGAGGDVVAGRIAAEDSIRVLDEHLSGVRLAVAVTALGGGTGGGATLEAVKHLASKGVPVAVFATIPFAFEGEDRQRNSRGILPMIEDAASATFALPLDALVDGCDNMDEAMRRAVDTVAGGVTLFWRLVEKPGYIRLDVERIRRILSEAGRGRFAVATAQGPGRAGEVVEKLLRSRTLSAASGPVRSALVGVLAGADLLLSEVGTVADGVKSICPAAAFDLATVNDEETFSGRICAVAMLFESGGVRDASAPGAAQRSARRRKSRHILSAGPSGRGRFEKSEPTVWNGEDLDVPTFIRKNLNIDA